MTDNLNTIIKHHQEKNEEPKEDELNIEIEKKEKIKKIDISKISNVNDFDLQITNLSNWFNKQLNEFSNINYINIKIDGIDKYESIILTILDPNNKEKRKLKVINNANILPVLNYKAIEMNIYNSGFSITNLFNQENKLLRCYGIKTGLIITHCIVIDNCPIPYYKEKIDKKRKGINFKLSDCNLIKEIINKQINMEDIILLYPQLIKENVKFKTNLDAIKWFNSRREKIMDINHLLKIDSIIIKIIEQS